MRRIDKVLSAVFVAAPLVVLLAGVPFVLPDTDDLNRAPVPLPEISPAALLDAGTYSGLGGWLRDRVPLRERFRRLDVKINRGLFHDVDDAAILDGRDGWLFFDPELANGLQPGFDPADIRAGIARLERKVTAAGKTFRLAFAPHKATIYPQYLRDRDQVRQAHVRERLEAFRALMRAEPVPGYLDVWDEMEAAAAAAAPEPLYYPRDTHWASRGAVVMAEALIDSLSPGMFDTAHIATGGRFVYTPDLVRYAGLNETETWQRFYLRRRGVRTELVDDITEPRMRTEHWRARSSKTKLLPKIAIIQDSYGNALRPMLPQFFSEATFIHVNATETEFARKALAEADIVFFMMVERFLYQVSGEQPFGPYSAGAVHALDNAFAPGS